MDDRVRGISGFTYTAAREHLSASFTVNTVYGSSDLSGGEPELIDFTQYLSKSLQTMLDRVPDTYDKRDTAPSPRPWARRPL